jgi:Flp pilus assembly protein TadD
MSQHSGSDQRALAALEEAAARNPDDPELQLQLGKHYLANRQSEQAEQAFRRAGRLVRGSPQPRLGIAASLLARGMRDQARTELRKTLEQFPGSADAWFNLGNLQRAELQLDEAARCYRKVLAIRPHDESACLNLAMVLTLGDRFAEAEAALRDFMSAHAATADVLNNLGQALRYQRRFHAALDCYRRAMELEPAHRGARLNLAVAQRQAGRIEEAERLLRSIIAAEPDNGEARFQLSTLLLLEARWQEGWHEYAWRDTYRASNYSALTVPTLEQLRGRHVVVKSEQGLGDMLFFLRFVGGLSAVAASVAVDVDPRLRHLLPGLASPGAEERVEVMAGDLPAIAGISVAPPVPLVADAVAVSRVSQRLAALGPPPYVAVTWEAGTRLRESRKPGAELYKRVEPELLADALEGMEGTLLSIQRNPAAADLARFKTCLGARTLHDLGDVNADLVQALALLSLVDRYVGVSNTNTHLLAGLGGSGDVLVPYPPDWRWLLEGDRSPWFPGFRVYRETAQLSWTDALAGLSRALSSGAAK